ncbi:MAG: hypothetical protein K2X55_21615 [Burkholderiaceae bacterium]|nr:hypothetical protein [Burkholderiaceae bacterium]
MRDQNTGLYDKFIVKRADGRDSAGEKHADCQLFVLDITHDNHALPAIAAYAASCMDEFPQLAADLRSKLTARLTDGNEFVTVPDVTLPNGTTVPSFAVGKFLCSRGPMGIAQIHAAAPPWVRINYADAGQACEAIDGKLITERQALAIAHDIAQQDINWTGGKVGEGNIYQGLHLGNFSSAQAADVLSDDPKERRWHQLSNGERIFDFAGNAFSWVFDDVQGDEQGIVSRAFAVDSPSISTAPHPGMTKGMGWRPDAGADWSGYALVRGGYWNGGARAGVFALGRVLPGGRRGDVGFRCTK